MLLELVVLALIVGSTTVQPGGFNIIKVIDEINSNVLDDIVEIMSRECTELKRLIGIDYEQLHKAAPDLSRLTLNFISGEMRMTYKLDSVAASLPKTPGYDPRRPLVIFMHGFIDDPTLFAFPIVNEAFQSRGDYNILALDASSFIRFLYMLSSTFVQLIGEKLGDTLAAMVEAGLDSQNIHLVGHSLGAHIASFAGKTFMTHTGSRVGRITGLDPAGPCFTNVGLDLRLKATDAEFVDVIHSDGGVYGLKDPVGHVDFFPNGGERQPSCLTQVCSHLRVVELFAESVRSPAAFPARRCHSWDEFEREQCTGDISLMGYGCTPGTKGLYYLRTGNDIPFSLGQSGLRPQSGGVSNTQ